MFLNRTIKISENASLNALLQRFVEFLDIVGRIKIIYDIYKFIKKHRVLIVEIFQIFVGFPIFVFLSPFLFLKMVSQKEFGLYRIFSIRFIRETYMSVLFYILHDVAELTSMPS